MGPKIDEGGAPPIRGDRTPPSAFMQNFSEGPFHTSILDEDTIYSNTGTGRVGFIDANDIARAAFHALTSPTSLNADYVLTGDEALTFDQVAEAISTALGRTITHINISNDELAHPSLPAPRHTRAHRTSPGRGLQHHRPRHRGLHHQRPAPTHGTAGDHAPPVRRRQRQSVEPGTIHGRSVAQRMVAPPSTLMT